MKVFVFMVFAMAISIAMAELILKWNNVRPSINASIADLLWRWPHQVDEETRRYLKFSYFIGGAIFAPLVILIWIVLG